MLKTEYFCYTKCIDKSIIIDYNVIPCGLHGLYVEYNHVSSYKGISSTFVASLLSVHGLVGVQC